MAVNLADLRGLVNAGAESDGVLTQCLAFGESIVATYTAAVPVGSIPDVIRDEAVLTAASDQFHRRQAPNGVLTQVYELDGGATPVRISRDPFLSIKALLAPWVSLSSGLRSVRIVSGGNP